MSFRAGKAPRPVALVILDGWGVSKTSPSPVTVADAPVFRALWDACPHTLLDASGEAVGLRHGQMGDSNVGHLNIGAGRIVYQDIVRISRHIRDGSFFSNPAFMAAVDNVKRRSSTLHLMGLVSDGGVHSGQDHLYALIDLAKNNGLEKVRVHAFLDGRDVPPNSAAQYLAGLENKLETAGVGRMASVMGRFYAMDRDKRWERLEKAYKLLIRGEGDTFTGWRQALDAAYCRGETDEFVSPAALSCDPEDFINPGDSVIFFNFRADRAREITRAFVDDDFLGFPRGPKVDVCFCGMVRYEEDLPGNYAYLPLILDNTLGEVVSAAGLRQLRIAETEKYAHVTFFLNGKKDRPFPGEDRILVPSPKEVATYDEKPEMSAAEVTDAAIEKIASGEYDLMVINYANPDMVGHTGVFKAGVKALEAVDACLGRLVRALLNSGGAALMVADHGNIEELVQEAGPLAQGHTYHSSNPVPCILVEPGEVEVVLRNARVCFSPGLPGASGTTLKPGILADVAPTVLDLMGLAKPPEMDRETLIVPPFSGR